MVQRSLLMVACGLLFASSALLLAAGPTPESPEPPALVNEVGVINGYVVDSLSRETMISATVALKGTRLGAFTNKAGFFSIADVPPGDYTLIVTFLGYKPREVAVSVKADQATSVEVEMSQQGLKTESVEVIAEKEVEKRQITISKVNIPVEQLKQLRIGGEADVFRSLQYLPGVLTSSQLSSGLYIRGGSPDQNLVLLDGTTVYNPSHLFGFFSTFNTDAIKDVELIKGGFPATYGGRLSAVLDMTQKDGNQNEFGGLASLGLVSSRLSMEGPIGNGSWFLGGRRTYLDLIANFVPDDPEEPFPDFAFYDLNAKISQKLSDNDRIFFSGFMSADDLTLEAAGLEFNIGISNRTGSLRWTHLYGDNFFTILNLTGSRYTNGFNGENSGFEFEVENYIQDYSAKGNFEWFTSEDLTLKGGFEISSLEFGYFQNFRGDRTTVDEGESETGSTNLEINDMTYALFGQSNYQVNQRLSLQAGLRLGYIDLGEELSWDPRLALRYQLDEDWALKLAWGVFHQHLRLASNPDFTFFDTWLPTDSTVPISSSAHYIAAIETDLSSDYSLNLDVYYKTLDNISELNRFVVDARTTADVFFVGEGESYGAEIFVQKLKGRLTGWVGYSLGWIEARFDSINQGRSFRPKYDRRHDFKVVANYELNEDWTIGGSFTFQSGQSYTPSTSQFASFLPGEEFGNTMTIPADRYSLRLPNSHQLNLNVNYNFTMWDLPARLLIDVFNVYSRRDIWFRFYETDENPTEVTDVRLLPILPTVALEVKF